MILALTLYMAFNVFMYQIDTEVADQAKNVSNRPIEANNVISHPIIEVELTTLED